VPRTLAPAPKVDSPLERRALEFFFLKTSLQLAGFFDGAFFQGSVPKFSIGELAIRQVIAAITIQYKRLALGAPSPENGTSTLLIQLYNRSIRAIIEKTISEPNPYPVVAMANILFICFEYVQGNVTGAAKHIQSGIRLLRAWREKDNSGTGRQP
jgi:hypothetical protein